MPFGKAKMKLITLLLPQQVIEKIDEMVREGYFPHRSEAIRIAVYAMLMMSNRIPETDDHQFAKPPKKNKKIKVVY